ncbi:MAG: acyltransferase, partial [Gemmatimonadaceae bacterium]
MTTATFPDSPEIPAYSALSEVSTSVPRGYMPQLDSLRWFAVLFVLWSHLGSGPLISGLGLNGIGVYGARLFFVLSGFLISAILLEMRDGTAGVNQPRGPALRAFYFKRFLRVVPAYYALVLILAAFDLVPGMREDMPWHLSFTSNWKIFADNAFPAAIGSFWTLSVEATFYLLWPFVILLTPPRRLPVVLVATVVFAMVFRGVLAVAFESGSRVMVATFSSFDCLAIGSLLAWHFHTKANESGGRRAILRTCLAAGGLILVAVAVMSFAYGRGFKIFAVIEPLGTALVFVWLV